MKIRIIDFNQDGTLNFSTEYGLARGKWAADAPVLQEYNVEIEIEDTLFWNKNVLLNDCFEEQIAVAENNQVVLKGKLESIDEDNCAVLRIKNSIILFVAEGEPFPIGTMIKIIVENISLYPY